MRPSGRRVIGAAAVLLSAAAFLACLTGLREPDTFHHLAMGREILARGLPAQERFLFPMAGVQTGVPPYWLGSIVIYLAQRLLGDPGPMLLAAATGAALFLVLFLDALDGEEPGALPLLTLLVPLVLALGIWRVRAQPRPEILAVLFLALTLLAVRRHATGRGRLLLAFPLLAAVWANVHSSVLAGVAAVGIHAGVGLLHLAAGRLARRNLPGAPTPRQAVEAAAASVLGLAGALLSPSTQGPVRAGLAFATTMLGTLAPAGSGPAQDPSVAYLKHYVLELRPVSLELLRQPVGIMVAVLAAATLASFALRRRKASLRELATVILFGALGATAIRFVPLAAVVAAPIAARNLAAAAADLRPFRAFVRPLSIAAAAAALACAAAATALAPEVPFGVAPLPDRFPVRAADYLAAASFQGRVFDTFQLGGYLEWRLGIPVYQDGRGFLRPDEVESALAGPPDRARFRELDQRYRFDALVIAYPEYDAATAEVLLRAGPLTDWGADRTVWALVAFDDGGLLYLRRDGAAGALAARDEYRFAMPATSLSDEQFTNPIWAVGFLRDMQRASAEAPACRTCHLQLGLALMKAGRLAEAEHALLRSLGASPVNDRYALAALAEVAAVRGDQRAGWAYCRRGLATGVDPAPLRRTGAALLLRLGDAGAADELVDENLRSPASATEDDLALARRVGERLADGSRALRRAGRVAPSIHVEAARREALTRMHAGDRAGAIAALLGALQWDESRAPVHALLGELYFSGGDGARAMQALQRAAQLDPELADPRYYLGVLHAARGDRAAAAEAFRAYLRLRPRGSRSLEVERQLEALGVR